MTGERAEVGRGPGAGEALGVAFAAAAGLVAANLLAWPLFALLGAAGWSAPARLAAGALVAEVGLGIPVALAVAFGRLGLVRGLGLARPRLAPTVFALLAVAGGGVLLDEGMHLAVRLLPWLRSDGLEAVGAAIAAAGPAAALGLLAPLALAPALVEEALCRGLLLRGLGRALPGWAALVASSAYFGLLHFDRLHGPIAFLMGLLLGFVVLRTGSLWPAIACHLLNNAISVLVPAAGGPSLPEVMDRGLPAWLVAAGGAALVAGLAGLVRATRSKEPGDRGRGGAGRGEEARGQDGLDRPRARPRSPGRAGPRSRRRAGRSGPRAARRRPAARPAARPRARPRAGPPREALLLPLPRAPTVRVPAATPRRAAPTDRGAPAAGRALRASRRGPGRAMLSTTERTLPVEGRRRP